mgnify:CR=1 FL=1
MSWATWAGVTLADGRLALEWGERAWRGGRPERWLVQAGLVTGPLAMPMPASPGANRWTTRAHHVIRAALVVLPWLHVATPWGEIYGIGKLFEAHEPPRARDAWRAGREEEVPAGMWVTASVAARRRQT